jgi:alternate signal-mediated exported protein
MKKSTKGAVACGAAALILAGGAGSMAAWSASSPSTGGGTASSGHLTVTATSAPSWTWATGGTGAFDPATMTLSPGDSVHLSGTYTLGIKGTNLKATATVTSPGAGSLPAGLTFTPDAVGGTLTNLTQANDGQTVTAGGVLTFASSATSSMDQSVNVSGLALTLQQN